MIIKINQEKCIGCGTCAALAGETFKMNEEGKAEVLPDPKDDKETIEMAAASCPVDVIEVGE